MELRIEHLFICMFLSADCDIRSCLNTLQFLNKKKEALNIVSQNVPSFLSGINFLGGKWFISLKYCFSQLELGSQVVGRKDMTRSVTDVWKEVNCLLFSL